METIIYILSATPVILVTYFSVWFIQDCKREDKKMWKEVFGK